MSSKNDIDSIINNLSQNNYTFDENLLVKDEKSRGGYVNT